MRNQTTRTFVSVMKGLLVSSLLIFTAANVHAQDGSQAPVAKKKWTVLVYLNGNNNLDSYGAFNINQMEKIGSTEDMNVVVQWASYKAKDTKRVFVTKDSEPSKVTSKIVESLPRVDMGDYKQLAAFLEWGIQNYPAEHYFVDVWNHGNGWKRRGINQTRNISYDDFSGNSISTPQLRMALEAAQAKAGQKIDIYGSDACLMNMVEVGTELAGSVNIMVGSQETEPGDGWPYDTWLQSWTARGLENPSDAAIALTDSYIEYYENQRGEGVTFSAVDLTQLASLNTAIKAFTADIMPMAMTEKTNFKKAIVSSANYYNSDYVDLMSMIDNMKTSVSAVSSMASAQTVKETFAKTIIANKVFDHEGAGLSIWAPSYAGTYNTDANRYKELRFEQETGWGTFLSTILAK